MSHLNWYAVQVATSKEMFVAFLLAEKGYEHFVPVLRAQPNVPLRSHKPRSLLPGYVFCRVDTSVRQPLIVKTPGVIRLLGFGSRPVPIPDEEISSLMKVSASPYPVEKCAPPEFGMRVRITGGPLKGAVGTMQSARGQDRFVVQICLLNRAVAVEISADSVRTIEPSEAAALGRYRQS